MEKPEDDDVEEVEVQEGEDCCEEAAVPTDLLELAIALEAEEAGLL